MRIHDLQLKNTLTSLKPPITLSRIITSPSSTDQTNWEFGI
ncbi:hypothetical protein CIPAW_01G214200 [Carya illinoinensis]|uniref:Uncharacterized protein n=1 Tax=Carya illinoinensis TaxID=32201 RepID=A0A8T1RNQ6_CARIL|nr:hypothetical protein CIPAW_01G214200 [Carya illinoinensis]